MGVASLLLSVDNLIRDYSLARSVPFGVTKSIRALDGVTFTIRPGESFGIVGASGSGKSTLARTVVALEVPTAGAVRFKGEDLFRLSPPALRLARRHLQMVFQDPYGSLDPRHQVGRIIGEPMSLLGPLPPSERRERVAEALVSVGLQAADTQKYPHEFSGGQRQRIAIARALITRPELIVADEPVSALDVSVQAQVLNLMMDLQEEHGLAYLFISHDLSVIRHVTDRVAVLQAGRIVEEGPTAKVLTSPSHEYTQALLDAVPMPDPRRRRRGRHQQESSNA
jgi:peptide/nickel transport system ATP-binding protein